MAFDEIFSNLLIFSEIKKRIKKLIKKPKIIEKETLAEIRKKIPFSLTSSQDKVCAEILNDITSEKKMLRVLQGDVGS